MWLWLVGCWSFSLPVNSFVSIRRHRRSFSFQNVHVVSRIVPGIRCNPSSYHLYRFSDLDDAMKSFAKERDADSILRLHHEAILQDVDNLLLQAEWSNRTSPLQPPMEDDAAILHRIDSLHDLDCAMAAVEDAPLIMEPLSLSTTAVPSYEWVFLSENNRSKVVLSKEPLLNATVIQGLRQGANAIWSQGNTSSRFTYQFQSNYEVHVADILSRSNASLQTQFHDALQHNMYPLLRHTLLPRCDDDEQQLFVYDALIIRYNATTTTGTAGQPLHRDYGLATVNVLLNDPTEFDGSGGTFLEEQLSMAVFNHDSAAAVIRPLHPQGVGYGLAHLASQRHAGAGITRGIREILVVFVTSTTPTVEKDLAPSPPSYRNIIRNTQLKQCRQYCEERYADDPLAVLECRIRHQRLAMRLEPSDGEAVQYLGTALMNYAMSAHVVPLAIVPLELARRCFALASVLTPYDHRVYNNWGIAQSRLRDMLLATKEEDMTCPLAGDAQDMHPERRIDHSYQRALALLEQSRATMGRVASLEEARASTLLNYALELANREAWVEAVQVLERIPIMDADDAFRTRRKSQADPPLSSAPQEQVLQDAYKLWQFCKLQIMPSSWNI